MATHNGARFVSEQMESILTQLNDDDELVVTDDASDDNTVKIINDLKDPRIRLLPSKTFNNPAKNFEYGLNHCRHDIIFLADQDDVWYPNKIKIMLEVLSGCDLAVCDCRLVDEHLNTIEPSFFELHNTKGGLVS